MRRKIGLLMITGGVLLIVAALLLIINNINEDRNAAEASYGAVGVLKEHVKEVQAESQKQEAHVPDYVATPMMEMPIDVIDGVPYVGYISIPELGLELPVISEFSETYLSMAPCRYHGSVYTEDMVISAHNYPSHFAYISNLQPKAEVYFTDVDGNVFCYEVVTLEVLKDIDVEEMVDAGWDLSLFTCDYTGRNRVTIRCESSRP